MSERLLSQINSVPAPSFNPVPSGLLQRKCTCGNSSGFAKECAGCGGRKVLQRHSAGKSAPATVPAVVHDVLRSSGQPLDETTRSFMEPRFNYDFSNVRVHVGARAAESAAAVNASAYTVGRNIVFGARRYAPGTSAGQRLLAHELTHVVQQSGTANNSGAVNTISDSKDTTELEADTKASEIINGPPAARIGRGKEVSNSQNSASRFSGSEPMVQRDEHGWPINGYVINNSNEPVLISTEGKKPYSLKAHSTSGRYTEDIDHIQDKQGQWYKIGPYTVTVDKNGNVTGYECKVSNYGQKCPEAPKGKPIMMPGWKQGL